MEFRILGSLEIALDDVPLRLGGPNQRAVLAILLMHPNRVVPVPNLIDGVWGENPPRTARVQLQAHISALRRLFAQAGIEDEVIGTRAAGYLVRVRPGELDTELFDQRALAGQQALSAGAYPEAAAGLAAALSLWRGDPLSDLPPHVLAAERARLGERRLAVLENRVEADLALGRHADLVAELTALTDQHPLRERLHGQLMLAHYRCGRQADALAVYRNARSILVQELGLEPGVELRRLEQLVLAGEPARPASPTTWTAPAQLPADVADFTGRIHAVAQIREWLSTDENEPAPAVLVVAVAGQGGVGKTALAVHAAHLLADRFPDGQLHLDLRGLEDPPTDPMRALDQLLRALGVDGTAIPGTVEDRVAMYRTRMANQRMLVVLDNAADEAQVRPLLPGAAGSAVVLTSRSRLPGLEGAHLLDLDVLAQEEAAELLANVAGRERVAAEPGAAGDIIRLCGELPLAVRIAGARLAARPQWTVRRLADLLSDRRRRLDELRVGDLEVRASVTLSYDGLKPELQQAFRRLGLLDTTDFASWVVAAVGDTSLDDAERLVDTLVDAQLLEVVSDAGMGKTRFRMHDLVSVYARERAESEDLHSEQHAAARRALGGWLALADRASDIIGGDASWIDHSAAQRWRPHGGWSEPPFEDPLDWFEQERGALIAAVEQAATQECSAVAWDLANSLGLFLELRGGFWDWQHTHQVALTATRHCGDRRGTAVMLRGLSEVHTYQDRYDAALSCLEQALDEFRQTADIRGEADTYCGFGLVHRLRGRNPEALQAFQRAVTLLDGAGNRPDRGYALLGVARSRLEQGELERAEPPAAASLACFQACGYRHGTAQALHNLGILRSAQLRWSEAVTALRKALEMFAELGEHHSNAYAVLALGNVYAARDQPDAAQTLFEQCLQTFVELGDPAGEARSSHSLGAVHARQGAVGTAVGHLARSARIWGELELPAAQADALRALGAAQSMTGGHDPASAADNPHNAR